ncbi:hypothetical protein VTK73DRAFT_5453 [Phialemonium thermophilum]|uniref:Uncharacterized protein n=1 Tax=Phialemonium thermophilum TaxID=223376 RepID=A0ABR3V1U6_9PEZI
MAVCRFEQSALSRLDAGTYSARLNPFQRDEADSPTRLSGDCLALSLVEARAQMLCSYRGPSDVVFRFDAWLHGTSCSCLYATFSSCQGCIGNLHQLPACDAHRRRCLPLSVPTCPTLSTSYRHFHCLLAAVPVSAPTGACAELLPSRRAGASAPQHALDLEPPSEMTDAVGPSGDGGEGSSTSPPSARRDGDGLSREGTPTQPQASAPSPQQPESSETRDDHHPSRRTTEDGPRSREEDKAGERGSGTTEDAPRSSEEDKAGERESRMGREEDEEDGGDEENEDDGDEENEEDDDEENEEDDDDDDEDEEPRLKYARLTPYLGAVYRNGDATSAFLVAGDKMVSGREAPGPLRPPFPFWPPLASLSAASC